MSQETPNQQGDDNLFEPQRGRGNPGRTEEDELEDRVELTYRLLSDGMRKSEIKQALKATYGVCARTAENYLSRARIIQLEELREERDIHRGSALAFYKRILSDSSAKISDKLTAQKRIDDLLGLAVPFRVAMQIREQTQVDDSTEFEAALETATLAELKRMREVYERADSNATET